MTAFPRCPECNGQRVPMNYVGDVVGAVCYCGFARRAEPSTSFEDVYRTQTAEITRLRAEVEALKAENAALASWQCLFTDGTTGLYHDGCGNAQCARDHLVVHLTAEVEALRADAERWRYINERNGEWRRFEADGPDPAYSMLCVRLPYDADLSCRATREIAIDAARAAQGEKS